VRSALNRIAEVSEVQLTPYADIYTLTFRPGVTPNEEMVRKVFKGCAFTGRKVELLDSPDAARPLPTAPPDNPTTPGRAALGERLFMDKRLSADGTVACATCHQPQRAFTNGLASATGLRGQQMRRNVPTLVNVGYRQTIFWDGRAETLEKMAIGALEHPAVIDMTAEELTERLRSVPTPFDRFARGDQSAISEAARRGWRVFCDKANCITCHAGLDFTDDEFRRIGIGWNGKDYTDLGRSKVNGKPQYAGMFRVPPLRELRWTAPYMHDGSLKTLEEVVDHYDRGGTEGAPTDLKGPLKLTAEEKRGVVVFLESLSSPEPTGRQGRQPNASYRSDAVGQLCRRNNSYKARHTDGATASR
jgi:cytochrome c peroxidase